MHVEFTGKNLQSAIKSVKRIFDKAPVAEPGDGHDCLIASKADGVTLESANRGMHVRANILSSTHDEGAVVIRRDYLAQIRFQGETVAFQYKPGTNRMQFAGGNFKGEINVSEDTAEIDAQRPLEIPSISTVMPTSVLRDAVKRTCFATSSDTPLKMHIQLQGGILTLSTNDQFRAAAVRLDLEDAEGECDIVVPAVFFSTVLAAVDDDQVRLGFNDRSFRIKGGGIDVTHPVLQDDGPKVADVWAIATRFENDPSSIGLIQMQVADAKEAIAGLASMLPSATDRSNVDLHVSPKSLVAKIRTNLGQADAKIETRTINVDQKLNLSLDVRFLLEFLGLTGGEITMKIWDKQVLWWSEEHDAVWFVPRVNPTV
jgi:DNA polymerase III sliding clamp (beta) subunit (PCNA family)